jgi:uncharacterized protein (DUF1778 family)
MQMRIQSPEPVVVRFRPADKMVIKAAAELRGETLSGYVRRVVTTAARETIDATIPDRDA